MDISDDRRECRTEAGRPELGPVQRVPVDALQPADSPRRSGENPEHTRLLAESDTDLPPIIVHHPSMQVIDGMHRLRATALRGGTEIDVRCFTGSAREAFVLAVQANTGHGLPLSMTDRQAAARRILDSHPEWSDRVIASITGLAAKTVRMLRDRVIPHANGTGAHRSSRVGRDGRVRPVDSSEGRRLAGRLLEDAPEASLREIARKAGVSPGTVRDVRRRLHRGEDPVPQKRPAPGPAAVPSARPKNVMTMTARPSRISALQGLYRDPSLRQTENGRLLLRLLEVGSVSAEQWNRLVAAVPAHRADAVSAAAAECAEAWQEFADRLAHRRCAP